MHLMLSERRPTDTIARGPKVYFKYVAREGRDPATGGVGVDRSWQGPARLRAGLGGEPSPPQVGRGVGGAPDDAAGDDAGIGLSGGPVEALGPEGRRPRGPGSYVRHG